jgi:hypothetical protein
MTNEITPVDDNRGLENQHLEPEYLNSIQPLSAVNPEIVIRRPLGDLV